MSAREDDESDDQEETSEDQPADEGPEDSAEKPAIQPLVVTASEDDGVPHDLNYYVQKTAQNLEEKGNEAAAGGGVAASDSEDEAILNQYLGTVKLYQNGMGNVSTLRNRTVRYADLSGNKIKDLDGVALPNIARLRLDFNRISSLDILNGHDFRFLRKLELRGNRLKSTAGIKHPFLEELYLAENDIREIEDLEFCPNLKRLHLRDNQILDVAGFSKKNAKLEYVNLRNNLITFIDDAMGITVLPRLKTLVMLDNPVQLEVDFRMVIIARMPTLALLDKEEVKPYDRDWSIMTLLDSLYHEQVDLKVAVEDLMDAIEPVEMADMATLPPSQTSLTSETDFMEDEEWENGQEADEEVNEADDVELTNSKDLLESKSLEEDDLDREYYGEKEPKEDEEDEGEQET